MPTAVEAERFVIEDEGDGWIKLERRGGDSMSLLQRELPELVRLLGEAQRGVCAQEDTRELTVRR